MFELLDRMLLTLAAVSQVFDLIGKLEGSLEYYRERHEVVAGNIANLDTPGFRSKELASTADGSFGGAVDELVRTNSRHLAVGTGGAARADVVERDDEGAGPDGNNVRLEEEMAKLEANRVGFRVTSQVIARRLAMLRYAAGDGNG
ncbi:MAG: flagellar basal body rod protein FlgB [Deltaproteobacteria bacterium]|nr:flagellar basal body rod protein FlgB [Deltaproteobacteria bacterium]